MSNYSRKHNQVSIGGLSFEVISYKIDHVKTISNYFTLSNITKMYTNGIKPYFITLKGYFPKSNNDKIILLLETLIFTSQEISFVLDGLSFNNVSVSKYSLSENVSSMIQEVEISFMGLNTITQEVTSDE